MKKNQTHIIDITAIQYEHVDAPAYINSELAKLVNESANSIRLLDYDTVLRFDNSKVLLACTKKSN